jgi:hypothetical protein
MNNSEFLLAAYGELQTDYGWMTSFGSDPNNPSLGAWGGQPWQGKLTQAMFVDGHPQNNNFFSVGVMHTDDMPRRQKGMFKRLAVLMADDADPENLAGPCSYIFETSPDNYQIGIFLDPADPDTTDSLLIDGVLSYMVQAGIVNADVSGNNPVRYARLPVGTNTKQRDSGPFEHKVHMLDSNFVYSLEDAAATFGVDLAKVREWLVSDRSRDVEVIAPKMDGVDAFKLLINPDLTQRSYHDPLLKITSAMVARGMDPAGALQMTRSLMLAIKPEEGIELARWEERFGVDLVRMVKGAEQKFAPAPDLAPDELILTAKEVGLRTQDVRWLVKHIVPSDCMAMVYGASMTFKSFIAIDMACHIANGMNWAGKLTEKGPVLIVAAEGGAGVYRRLEAWHLHHGLPMSDDIYLCITPLLLTERQQIEALRVAINKMPSPPLLVVIDTLAQTYSGSENDSSEISAYFRAINTEIRAQFHSTIIVVHHSGHAVSERPRGSSAIVANLDMILGVFRPDGDERTARVSVLKQKDYDKVDDLFFDMERLILGMDREHEQITSLVAKHNEDLTMTSNSNRTSKYESAIIKALTAGPKTESELRDVCLPLGKNAETARKGVRVGLNALEAAREIRPVSKGVWALSLMFGLRNKETPSRSDD